MGIVCHQNIEKTTSVNMEYCINLKHDEYGIREKGVH